MTQWDDIYKAYLNGGESWATLAEGVIEPFVAFVKQSSLLTKFIGGYVWAERFLSHCLIFSLTKIKIFSPIKRNSASKCTTLWRDPKKDWSIATMNTGK
ncbi:MAG: hypothetical protein G01um101418_723 [Parcubacteria group bacterium Gr01-1014_18]|nr:MAG: hypothetical protein Greene041636_713 [Parcubacteria group bacterium Greene0416_36]TSC80215.1 MAG: hypothetical protein G01um101418_723 [Parcubacteria group bacterium Gr01-1014_18]TSC98397.1 MAG: hypothetical protein Greene101420_750 [Parcubacteria group bacterium Greene1014_20]TSD06938.1 MAG: hypothetical protein Greene07142_501 [Parcubacteria group bacterium Greene0714_2]